MFDDFEVHAIKTVSGINGPTTIRFGLLQYEQEWAIEDEESGDLQAYDSKQAAYADYVRIQDSSSLIDVFGWINL